MLRSAQQRLEGSCLPDVIDDQQHLPVLQEPRQMVGSSVGLRESGSLFLQAEDQVFDLAEQVLGVLSECHPQDAVAVRFLDLGIIAERRRQGGLAVPSRTP